MPRIESFRPYNPLKQTRTLQDLLRNKYVEKFADPEDMRRYGGNFFSSLLRVLTDVERNNTHRGIIMTGVATYEIPVGMTRIETAPRLNPAIEQFVGRVTRIDYWTSYNSSVYYDPENNPHFKIGEDLLDLAIRHSTEDPVRAAIAADQMAVISSDYRMPVWPIPLDSEPAQNQWVIAEVVEGDTSRDGLKHVLPKELAEYQHAGRNVQVYGTPISV